MLKIVFDHKRIEARIQKDIAPSGFLPMYTTIAVVRIAHDLQQEILTELSEDQMDQLSWFVHDVTEYPE